MNIRVTQHPSRTCVCLTTSTMRQLRCLLATFGSKKCVSVSSQTVERSFPSTLAGSCRNSAPDLSASGPPRLSSRAGPLRHSLAPGLALALAGLTPAAHCACASSLSRATTYMSSMTRFLDHSHSIPPSLLKPFLCSSRHQTDHLPLLLSQKFGILHTQCRPDGPPLSLTPPLHRTKPDQDQ
jgi:hypothetical protein